MMDRYGIKGWEVFPKYSLLTLEGYMTIKEGDWIATGVKGEHWAIADDVFKASYAEVTE